MSASDREVPVRLIGGESLAEFVVLDSGFRRVDLPSSSGSASFSLKPGLYEIRSRHGSTWQSQNLLITPDRAEVDVQIPDAPGAAQWAELPDLVSMRATDGSTVVVELQSDDQRLLAPADADRLTMTLATLDGTIVEPRYETALIAGTWRFDAPPGFMVLRIGGEGRPPINLPVTLLPNARLRILCQTKSADAGAAPVPEIDLARLRRRLLIGERPDEPLSPERLGEEEGVLAGLLHRRPIFGAGAQALERKILEGGFADPMLAICAAHLLIDSGSVERPILLVLAIADQMGRPNADALSDPDLIALAARVPPLLPHSLASIAPAAFPPSLKAGWHALLAADRAEPGLIPPDSLAAAVAGRLLAGGLWVAWSGEALPDAGSRGRARSLADAAMPFDEARAAILSGLDRPAVRDWYRAARASADEDQVPGGLTPDMIAIAGQLRPVFSSEEHERLAGRVGLGPPEAGEPVDAARLAKALALPVASVERAAAGLAAHILAAAERVGIDKDRSDQ